MQDFGPTEIVDIGLAALAIYLVIVWLKQAKAGLAVIGACILAAIYLGARELRLELTAWMFQGVFALFFVVLLIVLQNDLRRLFERVAEWGVGRKKGPASDVDAIHTLCEALFELASRNCGALVVLPGRESVERHIEGGEELDGRVSRSLLLSLFDPGSVGHDGAAILEGGRISRFAVHLPLSHNFEQIEERGTRHSAALGLSESTDALVLVVSEERGEVSLACDGELTLVETSDQLRDEAERFLDARTDAAGSPSRRFDLLRRTWPDALLSIAFAAGLWYLFGSGAQPAQRVLSVPVMIENIDPSLEVESIDPPKIEIELAGLRRDIYLLDPTAVKVRVDASMAVEGRRTFYLSRNAIEHPAELAIRSFDPQTVRLEIKPVERASPTNPAANAKADQPAK